MAGLLQVMMTIPFGNMKSYTTVLFVSYESATTKLRWLEDIDTIYRKTAEHGFIITAESSDAGGAFRARWMNLLNGNPFLPFFKNAFCIDTKVYTIPDNGHVLKNIVATFEEYGPGINRRIFVDMAPTGKPSIWR